MHFLIHGSKDSTQYSHEIHHFLLVKTNNATESCLMAYLWCKFRPNTMVLGSW